MSSPVSTGDHHTQSSSRIEMEHEMNTKMLACPITSFQNSYLPFVPAENDVSLCLQSLAETGLFVKDSPDTFHWTDFPNSSSQRADTEQEQDFFSVLERIAQKVAMHTFPSDATPGRCNKPRLQYVDCLNTTAASEIKDSSFKTDGCFTLNTTSSLFSFSTGMLAHNIAVLVGYSKSQKGRAGVGIPHFS